MKKKRKAPRFAKLKCIECGGLYLPGDCALRDRKFCGSACRALHWRVKRGQKRKVLV